MQQSVAAAPPEEPLSPPDVDDEPPAKRQRQERQANSVANNPEDPADPSTPDDTTFVRSHTSARSSASSVNHVHGTNTTTQLTSSQTNPDPNLYFYCFYHGWNLSHSGEQCRVMLNDTMYVQKEKQASLPSDLSPRGNDAVEPQRRSQFLKSWGKYT